MPRNKIIHQDFAYLQDRRAINSQSYKQIPPDENHASRTLWRKLASRSTGLTKDVSIPITVAVWRTPLWRGTLEEKNVNEPHAKYHHFIFPNEPQVRANCNNCPVWPLLEEDPFKPLGLNDLSNFQSCNRWNRVACELQRSKASWYRRSWESWNHPTYASESVCLGPNRNPPS